MNYFEIFGLPVAYSIDEDSLNATYLKKQKALYKNPNQINDESSLLNSAYNTLSDPIKRAEYFLHLNEHSSEISMASENALKMFALREKFDLLSDDESREKFCETLEEKILQLLESLGALENNLDAFHEKFELILFMHSFLEKVRSNVYSGN